MHATRTTQPRARLRAAASVGALVVVLCLVGFAQTAPGQRFGRSLGLIPAARPVVSLAFSHPSQIASLTEAGPPAPRRVAVGFLVSTSGRQPATYDWQILGPHISAAGQVTATVGRSGSVRRRVLTGCERAGPARRRIEVRLRRPARHIDFSVTCRG